MTNPAPPAPLDASENVLAELSVDLDGQLRFGAGRVLLTDRRLLARAPEDTDWHAWPLHDGLELQHGDHGGVGELSLHDGSRLLARWRYTLGANPQALALLARFDAERLRRASGASDEPDEEAEDTDFAVEPVTPPSTWVLLRLWRFARPYRRQLLTGFALTLGATGAALVPPYLTIPLMDDVLIPFQNGQRIDPTRVLWLLAGLLGAALLAWGLGWARTWLLALVSERIGADLRTATFDHLLQLSLDYFGGKRWAI